VKQILTFGLDASTSVEEDCTAAIKNPEKEREKVIFKKVCSGKNGKPMNDAKGRGTERVKGRVILSRVRKNKKEGSHTQHPGKTRPKPYKVTLKHDCCVNMEESARSPVIRTPSCPGRGIRNDRNLQNVGREERALKNRGVEEPVVLNLKEVSRPGALRRKKKTLSHSETEKWWVEG